MAKTKPEVSTDSVTELVEQTPLPPSGQEAQKAPEPEIPAGHVLIAVLDPDGNETETFTAPEKALSRYYADETKYRLKKKAA